MTRLVALVAALLPAAALAHPLAPALLEIAEGDGHAIEVVWKTSRWKPTGVELQPVLPQGCTPVAEPTIEDDATGRTQRWPARCDAALVGSTIAVDGLATTSTNVIVRVRLGDGRVLQGLLDAGTPHFVVPERPSPIAVLRSYAALGVEHILFGFDHLLFVFGLLLLARGWRLLLETVTAFTLGHSVTLALATLGYATLPSGPVELLIALTILYLAVELATDRRESSWARRRPWLMAASFGLLHGLGFAGALREVGLPEGEIPLALLSFNVGIEAGQIAFVAVVVFGYFALRPLIARTPARIAAAPIHLMGTLAAYWCFERAAALW